ncbi:MAG: protease HtpX [Deltaproteobacteria bacterium]|nr:protease HtpX [Deltaproteobacteria bacterium]
MTKRVLLFVLVNFLIILMLSFVLRILGVDSYLYEYGINYESLLIFCAVFGFGGALISLALSRVMAKWMMGVRVINPERPGTSMERDLLQLVYRLAQKARLSVMPEVGIYDSPEVNAFATGPTKSKALVAVSAGLLQQMDSNSVEGVLAHEISHVSNGDMVTMTLVQGVVNTFVMFFARVAAWTVAQAMRSRDDDEGPSFMVQYLLVFVFEIFFGLLGMIAVAFFSRWREFRADSGGARLAGKEKMIGALQSLKQTTEMIDTQHAPSLAAFKINNKRAGLWALFASHPDLDTRIAALRKMA